MMTDKQARRIETLLAAHLAVATDTLLLMSLHVILGDKGVGKKETAEVFQKKAFETKALILDLLRSAKEDREHESAQSAEEMDAAEAALEAELAKPTLGFKP